METTITIPAGFKEITAETRKKQLSRDVNRHLRLEPNEILQIATLIQSELPVFKNSDNEEFYSVRILCGSSVKAQRILRKDVLLPYPKNRAEFLSQTQYGKDVLAFSGSEDEFLESLVGKKLIIKEVQDLDGTVWINDQQKEQKLPFHLFEYAE